MHAIKSTDEVYCTIQLCPTLNNVNRFDSFVTFSHNHKSIFPCFQMSIIYLTIALQKNWRWNMFSSVHSQEPPDGSIMVQINTFLRNRALNNNYGRSFFLSFRQMCQIFNFHIKIIIYFDKILNFDWVRNSFVESALAQSCCFESYLYWHYHSRLHNFQTEHLQQTVTLHRFQHHKKIYTSGSLSWLYSISPGVLVCWSENTYGHPGWVCWGRGPCAPSAGASPLGR